MNAVAVPIGAEEPFALPVPAKALAPDLAPRELRTQATYRALITKGIATGDASALIGYAVGLKPCQSRWSMKEINRVLFLRDLYANTAWGQSERRPA